MNMLPDFGHMHVWYIPPLLCLKLCLFQVVYTWKYVYNVHFLKQAEQTAQKCQRGYVLRQHSSEVGVVYEFSLSCKFNQYI